MNGEGCKVTDAGVFKEYVNLKQLDASPSGRSTRPRRTRNVKYEIIIPRADNSKNEIRAEELRSVVVEMSDHFNGVTMTPSQFGCDNTGTCEEVASIYSIRFNSTDQMISDDKAWMETFAAKVGKRFGQSDILVITDDLDYFTKYIPGERKEKLPESIVEKTDVFSHAVRT